MLNKSKTITGLIAIIIGSVLTGINSLPSNAQSNLENNFLTDLETENLEWTFSSEDESSSVRDEIKQLGEYNLSESDLEADVELSEENRKWGNRGDVEDYSVEVEVYDY